MNFMNDFKNKFIPFELEIKTNENGITSPNKRPNITINIVNSPIKLKKFLIDYSEDEDQIHTIFDIITSDGKRVACVDLRLTFSGKIVYQQISYYTHYNSDNLSLVHSKYNNGSTSIPYESFDFEKENDTGKEHMTITQVNGNVVGVSFSSTPQNAEANSTFQKYISSSLFTKPNFIGDFLELPYSHLSLDGTLLKYKAAEARFKEFVGLDDNCSKEELEKEIKKYKKDTKCDEHNPEFTTYSLQNYLDIVAAYLADEEHNLLRGFKGSYVGSILKNDESSTPLVVVTEQKKAEQTYRCYTFLVTPEIDTIRKSNKDPKYVTKVGKNGKEELVLYDGKPISENCSTGHKEYNKFVDEYITPFLGIQPIDIKQFIDSRSLSQESR